MRRLELFRKQFTRNESSLRLATKTYYDRTVYTCTDPRRARQQSKNQSTARENPSEWLMQVKESLPKQQEPGQHHPERHITSISHQSIKTITAIALFSRRGFAYAFISLTIQSFTHTAHHAPTAKSITPITGTRRFEFFLTHEESSRNTVSLHIESLCTQRHLWTWIYFWK